MKIKFSLIVLFCILGAACSQVIVDEPAPAPEVTPSATPNSKEARDAALQEIEISEGATLDRPFRGDVTEYTVSVAYEAASVTIKGIPVSKFASVSEPIHLDMSNVMFWKYQNVQITCKSYDKFCIGRYTFKVVRYPQEVKQERVTFKILSFQDSFAKGEKYIEAETEKLAKVCTDDLVQLQIKYDKKLITLSEMMSLANEREAKYNSDVAALEESVKAGKYYYVDKIEIEVTNDNIEPICFSPKFSSLKKDGFIEENIYPKLSDEEDYLKYLSWVVIQGKSTLKVKYVGATFVGPFAKSETVYIEDFFASPYKKASDY